MKLEIISGGESTTLDLPDGTITLGGSEADGVQLHGLPAGLLELRIEADRLMVVATETLSIDQVLSPPGVPRLVLAGEVIELRPDVHLKQVAPAEASVPPGTVAVLRSLLGDAPEPEEVQCASVTCLTGLDVGRRFPLAGSLAEIGRGEQVQVRVRDRAVSRRHARIKKVLDRYLLEDCGSPNGVYLNGLRLAGPTPLPDGAVIELGHSILRFKAPWSPPPGEESPAPLEEPPSPSDAAPEPASELEESSTTDAQLEQAPPRRARGDVAMICVGVTLALVGVLVTFGFVYG
ncbi:MAG: FHA domain-containing protein [Myxococcaceae bacterium]